MSLWSAIKRVVLAPVGGGDAPGSASRKKGLASQNTEKGLLVFHHTSEVIQAERVLREGGFQTEVMGPPPDLQTGCDMVLVFPLMFEMPVRNLLNEARLEPLHIVPLHDLLLEPVSLFQAVRYGSFLMVRAANMKITVNVADSVRIVNVSGGGCPDVPFLASLLVGKTLDEADEPRIHGKTLCSYSLQKAFEQTRRLLVADEWRNVPESPAPSAHESALESAQEEDGTPSAMKDTTAGTTITGKTAKTEADAEGESDGLCSAPYSARDTVSENASVPSPFSALSLGKPRRWLICGSVPDENFPLYLGTCRLNGETLELSSKAGSFSSLSVRRGTPALIAAALASCEALGVPGPDVLLAGDTGTGEGSRELYQALVDEFGKADGRRWDGLTFHYLFPDVDGHNQALMAMEALPERPLLVADAGFMYAAKMSGYAASYDLFTPDAGELAFLADEKAPHPFYTRGFLLADGDVPALAQAAAAHGDSARYLLIKGVRDYIVREGRVLGIVERPSVPAMEPIGGTGDLVTGMATGFLAAGCTLPEACFAAARANRLLAQAAAPRPDTQVAELLPCLPAAVRAQV